MKLFRIASAASFCVLAALVGAQAHAEDAAAAHAADPYADGASSGVVAALSSTLDHSAVQAEARALAHAPAQNLYVEAFVNSRVPAQYGIHGVLPTRQAGIADGLTLR